MPIHVVKLFVTSAKEVLATNWGKKTSLLKVVFFQQKTESYEENSQIFKMTESKLLWASIISKKTDSSSDRSSFT